MSPNCCANPNLIEEDGELTCANCGTIVAEFRESNVPEFMETSGGGHTMVGQIFTEQGIPQRRSSIMPNGHGRESREIVLEKGRRIIQHIVSGLRITQNVIPEASQRWYKLAVVAGFNKGRPTQILISSCVYVACRMNRPRPLPYMLIDFSEYLRINVFVLGHTFLELCKNLNIQLPLIDPSLFIPRFASQLNFGEKELEVSKTAIRIVARMKRDWILYGRRPSGVCGAGLMIASYLHNCKKTQKDIIKVVKISDKTLQSRLQEFEQVPSADLTPAEFEAIDFEHFEESDPPAFTRGVMIENEKKNATVPSLGEIESKILNHLGDISKEDLVKLSLLQKKRIEDALTPTSLKFRKLSEESDIGNESPMGNTLDDSYRVRRTPLRSAVDINSEIENSDESAERAYAELISMNNGETSENQDQPNALGEQNIGDGEEEEEDDDEEEEDDLESDDYQDDENLSDLEDDEALEYIYTEEEQRFKAEIWKIVHADYLKEKKEKELNTSETPQTKVRKAPNRNKTTGIEKLPKTVSSKINYNVLNSLGIDGALKNTLLPTKPAEEEEDEEEEEDQEQENEYSQLKRMFTSSTDYYDD